MDPLGVLLVSMGFRKVVADTILGTCLEPSPETIHYHGVLQVTLMICCLMKINGVVPIESRGYCVALEKLFKTAYLMIFPCKVTNLRGVGDEEQMLLRRSSWIDFLPRENGWICFLIVA